jgi:hypothetical protein
MHNKLTLEQQFEIVRIKHAIESAGADQLRILLIDLYESVFERENIVKELLAKQWGIDVSD